MKIAISGLGRFHLWDVAKELLKTDQLAQLFTGYPRFKLRHEQLPPWAVSTYPLLHVPYMALKGTGMKLGRIETELAIASARAFDGFVARRLPECDVFMGLSGSALRSGIRARSNKTLYVCDRGSSHIRTQNRLLQEEFRRHGRVFTGIDPRIVRQEELEYAEADLITVPSSFAKQSFLEHGISSEKIEVVPYGVDLARFHRTTPPTEGEFNVAYVGAVSLQKGIPYLLDAFDALIHPNKKLYLIGSNTGECDSHLQNVRSRERVILTGHIPQNELKHLLSRCHVFVLPSVQEGFGMVQAQAMACGCPVIATTNTGGPDLFKPEEEGFVVPIRSSNAILEKLQLLADDPQRQQRMAEAAIQRAQMIGGWSNYTSLLISTLRNRIAGSN
jgi:glycosyltransferase involved in cell wall biosynthesis